MTVFRKGNELIIRIPKNVDLAILQRLIDFINYNELTESSQANQEDIDNLSSEINKSWWKKNKGRFLDE